MDRIKRIINLVLNDIAEVYLYFLGFYIISLIFSHFFESWKLFFNWPAFHISVIVFGIVSLLSDKAKKIIYSERSLAKLEELKKLIKPSYIFFEFKAKADNFKIFLGRFYELSKIAILIFTLIKNTFEAIVSFIIGKIKSLNQKDFLKIGVIISVLVYSLFKGIKVIDFFILAYGLISILFIVESRIAAVIALLCLISCPILLIYKKEAMAETMAIYAYYFLVITVLTQIREYIKEEKEENKAINREKTVDNFS
jgi:hypothetical protein